MEITSSEWNFEQNFPEPYTSEEGFINQTVAVAIVFLASGLLITLSVVWYNKFLIPKKYSFFLFSWYGLYMVIAVLSVVGVIEIV